MSEPVHILATVRSLDLLPMTQLVFKTLRVGFPTASVTVHLNNLSGEMEEAIKVLAFENDCAHVDCDIIHHLWLKDLCLRLKEPFWILDCDVIFYESMEQFQFTSHLTGARVPQFDDEFSGCITRPRLHTSLLRIDPVALYDKVNSWADNIAKTIFTPVADLFSPLVVPWKSNSYFYDTASMLYNAVGGEAFQPKHRDTYCHFNWGSISDLVGPRLSDWKAQSEARKRILANPVLGRGVWREQQQYLEQRAA